MSGFARMPDMMPNCDQWTRIEPGRAVIDLDEIYRDFAEL
jgi:hypothetical protein